MEQSALSSKSETIWNKDFVMLLTINIFVFISFNMIMTSIAKFASQLGGDEAKAGLVAGIFSVSSLLMRPVAGNMADRINKKLIYVCALALIAVSILGYSISKSTELVILFRLLHGIGWAAATTVGMTMASNTAPKGKLSQCVGIYGLANVFGMAIAPNIGLYLAENFGYPTMFLVSFIIVFCALVILIFVKQKPAAVSERPVQVKAAKPKFGIHNIIAVKALTPLLMLVLCGMAYGSMTTFVSKYCTDIIGIQNPGMFFTAYAIMLLVVRPLGGKLADTKGEKFIVFPGSVLFIASLILISQATLLAHIIIAGALLGLGYGAVLPSMMSLAFKRVEPSQRGIASSTTLIGIDIGLGAGSAIAGKLVTLYGYSNMYLIFIFAVLAAVVVFFIDQALHGEFKRRSKAVSM